MRWFTWTNCDITTCSIICVPLKCWTYSLIHTIDIICIYVVAVAVKISTNFEKKNFYWCNCHHTHTLRIRSSWLPITSERIRRSCTIRWNNALISTIYWFISAPPITCSTRNSIRCWPCESRACSWGNRSWRCYK